MMQKGSVEAYEPALRRPRRERISAPGVAPDVLLSFAQFEREVTGERIRDKIAASKKKGMWKGGVVPLGYRVEDRALHIVDDHAAIVRSLFQRYLEAGSVVCLKQSLDAEGLRIPIRIDRAGRSTGGGLFSRGHVYKLLSNPIYVGRIAHKGQVHEGQHPPIVDQDLWDRVQQSLRDHLAASGTKRTRQSSEALLAELSADRRASQTDIRDRIDRVAISGTAIQIRLSEVGEGDDSVKTLTLPWTAPSPYRKETLVKIGMDPTPGPAAATVAKAYVAAVQGSHQGKILDPSRLEG